MGFQHQNERGGGVGHTFTAIDVLAIGDFAKFMARTGTEIGKTKGSQKDNER